MVGQATPAMYAHKITRVQAVKTAQASGQVSSVTIALRTLAGLRAICAPGSGLARHVIFVRRTLLDRHVILARMGGVVLAVISAPRIIPAQNADSARTVGTVMNANVVHQISRAKAAICVQVSGRGRIVMIAPLITQGLRVISARIVGRAVRAISVRQTSPGRIAMSAPAVYRA